MYPHSSCISNETSCYSFNDCPYWLAAAADANKVTCNGPQWQLARSETFTAKESQRTQWRLTDSKVRPAVTAAGLR
jgi:hypothetical protein